ncbi:MAG: type II secretion system protein [Coriobacteriales bacterium]|nr:type II secretion system protein [Coriobacteriales bacterium]
MRLNVLARRLGPGLASQRHAKRMVAGFSLTEMLVTMFIMVLASTLMATGIPVAVDTYQKTVNAANAQLALSTTVTVLRSEFGSSTQLDQNADGTLYYRCSEGSWASISNPEDNASRGLVKSFFLDADEDGKHASIKSDDGTQVSYPIVSSAAITEPLHVSMSAIEKVSDNRVEVKDLQVTDESNPPNVLAGIDSLEILVPFAE